MEYSWLDSYFLSKRGTRKDYQPDWQATRYFLSDKMYAMIGGDKVGSPILTLKCDPAFAEMLRVEHADIVPGYYMNKRHWNSVYLQGTVPDSVVKDMIDMSYSLVLDKLPRRAREETLSSIGD